MDYIIESTTPREWEASASGRLLKKIEDTYHSKSTNMVHSLYYERFNPIDLMDKKWYQFEYHYPIKHWRTKYILCMLKVAVLNGAVISDEIKNTHYKEYRRKVAIFLLSNLPN